MSTAGSADELSLVERAQQGDSDAFQILLHRYLPIIHRYAMRMLGNQTDASDIAQEVFIRFWQKSHNFDPARAKLSTWLHQIAHNLCIDHFRKHSKMTSIDGSADQILYDQNQEWEDSEADLATELQTQLKRAIESLPERQRSALIFCHYQGLSNKQAAEILNVSVDALESLLSRARRSLKNTFLDQSHG